MKTSTLDQPAARSAAQPVPAGMHSITPHLICANAVAAIDFYKKAFNAVEESRMMTPDGKLMHAMIRIGDSAVMLAEENPAWGALGPNALKGSSVTLHICVGDADAAFAQAVQAGAKPIMPVAEMFWGDRYGKLQDPYGHQWAVATRVRDLTPAEIAEGARKMCG